MRIITINVNGIRAAERKGFFSWLEKQNADVVCLQEIKAQEHQLDERFYPSGIHTYYHSCLLYTSPSPRDQRGSRMPSSA